MTIIRYAQESKGALTQHFNLKKKLSQHLITISADCSKNTFTTLLSIVDCCADKFYGGGSCSLLKKLLTYDLFSREQEASNSTF